MKKQIFVLATLVSMISLGTSHGQMMGRRAGGMGGPAGGPNLGGAMTKLFAGNSDFSATLEMQSTSPDGERTITIPGKVAFADGKSRFEADMSDMKGAQMPEGAMDHMKSMGMAKTITISLPDKKVRWLIYPDLQAYVEMPVQNPDATTPESDFKVATTELGKETVDGHPCVKNKVVVTDKDGKTYESTVWNATDLNQFPIKIETETEGHKTTMSFKDVKLSRPAATLFEAPTDYKKYDSYMSLMQQEMMKRMGNGGKP